MRLYNIYVCYNVEYDKKKPMHTCHKEKKKKLKKENRFVLLRGYYARFIGSSRQYCTLVIDMRFVFRSTACAVVVSY